MPGRFRVHLRPRELVGSTEPAGAAKLSVVGWPGRPGSAGPARSWSACVARVARPRCADTGAHVVAGQRGAAVRKSKS